jgi:hypothetical protein
MNESKKNTISFKRALLLALAILAIYFPIQIYVDIRPEELLESLPFLIFPAMITWIFYFLIIYLSDLVVDWSEKIFGQNILTGLQFRMLLLSIPFGIISTLFSNLLFTAFFSGYDLVKGETEESITQESSESKRIEWENWERSNNGFTLIISLSIFFLTLNRKATMRMKDMEISQEQRKKESALVQYEALKNQISPHFLFNSLSILSSMIHEEPDLSVSFIEQLSKAYRYILEQKDNDTIQLNTELAFIKSYSFLLKIRFENKFNLKISVSDGDAAKYKIAPLTLQLLIENCVKHNRMSEKEPLEVTISIEDKYLCVINAIHARHENEISVSTGIGLKNIINRYHLLTTSPVIVTNDHSTFIAKIPLLV